MIVTLLSLNKNTPIMGVELSAGRKTDSNGQIDLSGLNVPSLRIDDYVFSWTGMMPVDITIWLDSSPMNKKGGALCFYDPTPLPPQFIQHIGGPPVQVPELPLPSGPYLPRPTPQPQREPFSFLGLQLFSPFQPALRPVEASWWNLQRKAELRQEFYESMRPVPPARPGRRPGRPELLGD